MKTFELTERNCDIIYRTGVALLCLVTFASMAYLASSTSLWLDEVFEVDYCSSNTLHDIIFVDPFTPPLYNIVAWTWYHVAPYGELWLRLPSIVFVVASFPFIAMAGRRIGGRRTGFTAAFLLLINAKVYTQCGLSFRSYALLLFLATVYVYLYIRRLQTVNEKVTWPYCIIMGVVVLALGYTHYFGVLLACMFFLVDLYLAARGRMKGMGLKVFVSYAIPVVFYLPWLYVAFGTLGKLSSPGSTEIHWQNSTAQTNIHGLLYWLCGECAETLGLFHVAAIMLLVVSAYRAYKRTFIWRAEMPQVALLFATWMTVSVMWVYATFINTSSMFWVERYFIPLVPCIMLLTAWGVYRVFSWIPTNNALRFVAGFLCVMLLVPTATGTINNDLAEGSSTRFYRDLTEYLVEQDDISDDKTLVLALVNSSDRGGQLRGWKTYYFDQKGTRDFQVNMLDGLDPSVQLNPYDLLRYETIYVTCQHFDPEIPRTFQKLFDSYYKEHVTDNPGGGRSYRYTRER